MLLRRAFRASSSSLSFSLAGSCSTNCRFVATALGPFGVAGGGRRTDTGSAAGASRVFSKSLSSWPCRCFDIDSGVFGLFALRGMAPLPTSRPLSRPVAQWQRRRTQGQPHPPSAVSPRLQPNFFAVPRSSTNLTADAVRVGVVLPSTTNSAVLYRTETTTTLMEDVWVWAPRRSVSIESHRMDG